MTKLWSSTVVIRLVINESNDVCPEDNEVWSSQVGREGGKDGKWKE